MTPNQREMRVRIGWPATVLVLGTLLLIGSTAASAQFPGGGMPGGGMPGKSGGPGGRPSRGDEIRAPVPQELPLGSVVQTRLVELRTALAIESSQRSAWDRYSQCVLRLLDDIRRVDETTLPSEMTGPQRLEHVADLARNRLTATEDLVEAGNALYALLTPPQRAVADRRMADVAMPMFGARRPGEASARGDRGQTSASSAPDGELNARAAPPRKP